MAAKFPSPLPIRITLEVRKVFTNFFMLYLCRVEYDFCVFARKKFVKSLGGRDLASHLLVDSWTTKDGRQISVAASHQNHFRGYASFQWTPASTLSLSTLWSLRGNPGMIRCKEMATLPAGYIPQRKLPSVSSSGSLFHCVLEVL